ncbi:hypothetical protein EYR36_006965 [Pleurotus pulmonarius]|nr:hypothetical protein EYR36_006965 [Pleurotus pulmonarius]
MLLVASAGPGFSASFNVTVDDKFGPSPPKGSAIQFGEGWFDNDFETCGRACEGTAVYVNAILTEATAAGVRGNSDITFLLDNQATYFLRNAPISRGQTAQTVFSVTNLANQNHTLTIINGRLNSSFEQMILLLDSIIYTMTSRRIVIPPLK